jgi:hypothetical protein
MSEIYNWLLHKMDSLSLCVVQWVELGGCHQIILMKLGPILDALATPAVGCCAR